MQGWIGMELEMVTTVRPMLQSSSKKTTVSFALETSTTLESTTVTTTTTTERSIENGNASFERVEESLERRCECYTKDEKFTGFGLCTGNSVVTELLLILMMFTNLLLAFCYPVILAIERFRVERMVKNYWERKRTKENNLRVREERERVAVGVEKEGECVEVKESQSV